MHSNSLLVTISNQSNLMIEKRISKIRFFLCFLRHKSVSKSISSHFLLLKKNHYICNLIQQKTYVSVGEKYQSSRHTRSNSGIRMHILVFHPQRRHLPRFYGVAESGFGARDGGKRRLAIAYRERCAEF